MSRVADLNPHTELDELAGKVPEGVMNAGAIPSDARNRIGADHRADFAAVGHQADFVGLIRAACGV